MIHGDKVLYTIGHSTLAINDFIRLLKDFGISTLIDVRSAPYSRYAPQFNKERLQHSLTAVGIEYIFLGDFLGGIPKDKTKVKWGMMPSIQERERLFEVGIKRLLQTISRHPTAIMCAEENPLRCHRRHKIGAEMHRRGVKIKHIRSRGVLERDDFGELVQGSLSLES
ncbi:MAG: DUF488 domain-containing protein [Thermodesulfovibrionales bacterium]|nr:DUF488 domain-containing protein [Thermodesulfovibrionales bacterium]